MNCRVAATNTGMRPNGMITFRWETNWRLRDKGWRTYLRATFELDPIVRWLEYGPGDWPEPPYRDMP